jgi:hypothetical protein
MQQGLALGQGQVGASPGHIQYTVRPAGSTNVVGILDSMAGGYWWVLESKMLLQELC